MSRRPENKIQLPAGVVLVVLVCLVAYVPAIRSGFVWDDDAMLTENIVLKEHGLYRSWFSADQPNYWPITWTSYRLEHKFWKLNPAGYHITNILIHTACALLIWRILVQLNVPAAFAAALIFAVHPVNVESVAWIAQRKTVLAMLFFLLSLFYYLRFDQTGKRVFYVLSVTLFILAMLSKGSVVGLPVVILLCIWWLHKAIARQDILRSIPFFVISAVMSIVEIWFQYNRAIAADVVRSDSFLSRLAGAGWAVWFYLYKAVLPIHLTFIYPRWKIDPTNLVSYVPGLLLLVLLALAWRYRRSWGRPVFFALSFYIVMLLPVLGFFNIYFMRYSLVADHYQYVSIISVICLAVGVIYRYLGAGVLKIAAVFALMILGGVTWQRSGLYKDAETLWNDTLRKTPNCVMAHTNLGNILQLQGRINEAIGHFHQALQDKTSPDYTKALYNMARTSSLQGRFDEAINYYREVLQINPNYAEAHNGLGTTLSKMGKFDDAITHYRKALQIKPALTEVYANLGNALLEKGNPGEAIDYLQQALLINPDSAETHYNLAIALKRQGRLDEAVSHYQQALHIKPGYADAQNNLAVALLAKGNVDEAINHYRLAIQFRPNFIEALYNLGCAFVLQGKTDEAVKYYNKVLQIDPNHTKTRQALQILKIKKDTPK
jgi:tetratricopeptide (TPR) repeat protein